VPETPEEQAKFSEMLMEHDVSLKEYIEAMEKPNFIQ